MARIADKILLIGWDSADWKIIQPLLDQGLMPTLRSMMNQGVWGNLATLRPALSPILWNSIATGKRGDQHGILAFVEPDPHQGMRTVRSTSRKCKALWNILTQSGMKSNVVSWFASYPAEPINGVIVADSFARYTHAPLPMPDLPPGTIHPDSLSQTLSSFRVHASELGSHDLTPFMPHADRIDQDKDRRLGKFAHLLAECCSVHAVATWLLEHQPADLHAVYYETIDRVKHDFMAYHPPKMQHVTAEDFEIYKDVVTGIYRYHDMMLERLLQLAGPDCTVMLISDHGFHSDHLRPSMEASPTSWHRPFGIICIKGPNIRQGERLYGANLLDIAPTILAMFGLPVAADMSGRVLLSAFKEPMIPSTIESWESMPGDAGLHPPDLRIDPLQEQQALQQLIDLGYVEAPPVDVAQAARQTEWEIKCNLAEVYVDAGAHAKAAALYEELLPHFPGYRLMQLSLAQCYQQLGRAADCRNIIESILADQSDAPLAHLIMGMLLLSENQPEPALAHLTQAEQQQPRLPHLHLQIGQACLKMNRWSQAERAFEKALQIDGDSAMAHFGLATARFEQGDAQMCAVQALRAVGLVHHMPRAHYLLGLALIKLERFVPAARAMETCLTMLPHFLPAHQALVSLYRSHLSDPIKSAHHQQMIALLAPSASAAVEVPA